VIRTAISAEAFEAIARTLPLGTVGFENEANERGERLIWLEDAMADRLGAMRETGRATASSSCGSSDGRRVHAVAWLVSAVVLIHNNANMECAPLTCSERSGVY
jgi:hypothetical protein